MSQIHDYAVAVGHVLIADDDHDFRKLLVRRAKRMGLTVAEASDGEEAIEAVHYTYMELARDTPIVLDPVMFAKGGETLVDRDSVHLMRQHFLLRASIVTPNVPEVEVLAGVEIRSLKELQHAAEIMITLGCPAVLVKGGHYPGEKVYDVFYDQQGMEVFVQDRVDSVHTHGTGCTLASAIAVSLAQGLSLRDSVVRARS